MFVTNTSDTRMYTIGGTVLRPGESKEVPDRFKGNGIFSSKSLVIREQAAKQSADTAPGKTAPFQKEKPDPQVSIPPAKETQTPKNTTDPPTVQTTDAGTLPAAPVKKQKTAEAPPAVDEGNTKNVTDKKPGAVRKKPEPKTTA